MGDNRTTQSYWLNVSVKSPAGEMPLMVMPNGSLHPLGPVGGGQMFTREAQAEFEPPDRVSL